MGTETPPPAAAWIRPIPNLLTGLRLVLAVALPFAPPAWWLPIVLSAGVTDALDGWIARRFHAVTHLGRLLDGIADKAFALSTVVTLAADGSLSLAQGLVVLSRDIVVAALAAWLAARHAWAAFQHMQVRWAGKATTLLAFAWFATLLLRAPEGVRTGAFVLAAAASLWAAADYLVQFAQHLRQPAP